MDADRNREREPHQRTRDRRHHRGPFPAPLGDPARAVRPLTFRLETPGLALREMGGEDLAFLAEMLADPEVMRHYPKPLSRAKAAAWIERQRERYARDGHGLWLVVRRDGSGPVGQVGLVVQEIDGETLPEIGWMIHRPFWRLGYATEAALAVRSAAFGRF
ncbi:MAG TPA: GNAT family N-acetyltransferase, partial [Thermoanaerobaculia bacterium]|nr:GNAT family N-acetyltransferase [Thermoanaerobaculia bacterium]